jgi:hypothetical protein
MQSYEDPAQYEDAALQSLLQTHRVPSKRAMCKSVVGV